MIKNTVYIIKQKKILLKKKKIKFKLESKLKNLNFLLTIFKYKYLIFIQYFINSTENFNKLKLFLSNKNSNIILLNKNNQIGQKFNFLLKNNCAIIGLNNLENIKTINLNLKKNNKFLILGYLIDNILFSKYDLKFPILKKNIIIYYFFYQLVNFYILLKNSIFILIHKLQSLITYGNNKSNS